MTGSAARDLEANKQAARAFCELFAAGDWAALGDLLHDDFRWIACTSDRRQSPVLQGVPALLGEPGRPKGETLEIFAQTKLNCVDERFEQKVGTLTAEEDRVSVTVEGYAVSKANGRVYDNRYHHLMRFRDSKLVELREYQDTLLLFDVWMAP